MRERSERAGDPPPMRSRPQAAGAITRLSIACPDQPGIVAATSRLLTDAGANIVRSDQHTTDVESFGLPYAHISVAEGGKAESERRLLELLRSEVDVVVLARYMQILSGEFLQALGVPVINIHHSFLPAFAGAAPYQQAKERGVKLIGATAHYVTEGLDEGPIIEQDTVRVTHREDLVF